MRILFAAPEEAWGGIYYAIRSALPEYAFEATGCHEIQSLKGFDVLIPAMSSVTDALMSSSDRLRLIQQCGAALEGVDLDAARKRDVWVASVPTTVSGSADSAADLGIHFMIALAKDFKGMQLSFQDRKLGYPIGRALAGRTAGIVGLGGIGRALVKRLRAFGVRLIGTKRRNQQQAMEELGLEWVGRPRDLRLLLRQSDFVFLCLPLTHESRELMNHDTFPAMKVDSYLINLARGGLVVRDALEEALAAGRIAGAGMDVFWEEPPDPNDPIFTYNVLATPHIAGFTDASIRNVVEVVAENIRRAERSEDPLYRAC